MFEKFKMGSGETKMTKELELLKHRRNMNNQIFELKVDDIKNRQKLDQLQLEYQLKKVEADDTFYNCVYKGKCPPGISCNKRMRKIYYDHVTYVYDPYTNCIYYI